MARIRTKPAVDLEPLVSLRGHTRSGAAFTELILETFQLNGKLLIVGDRVTKSVGLTSARWQVMGRLNRAAQPLTVSHIARTMGLQRQSVQRTVDLLAGERLVELVENPHHMRSKLVALTQLGREKLKKVERLQVSWANRIAVGIGAAEINASTLLMRNLRQRLGSRGIHGE
jgi:DNA-binding MarR family transcriptional regulator